MKYLSVCSGIEAATVAWHDLGWKPLGFSEIEPFPSAVLAHHYPNVPNLGDMTRYKEWNIEHPDILVGGTPCQSFSVAGLRKGLADPRGNLALVYCGILDHFKPQWFVWENVPGVLSSAGGRDFGSFLGALAELGYGFAYRVLDAQFFGVAQRRRRVFVVGYLGDWRPPAAVLFERESLRRDTAPSREKRKVTPTLSSSGTRVSRVGFNCEDEWFIEQPFKVANCLTQRMHKGINTTVDEGQTPVLQPIAFNARQDPDSWEGRTGPLDTDGSTQAVAQPTTQYGAIAGSLTARHDSSPCADRGANVIAQPIGLDEEQNAVVDGFGCLKAREKGGGFEGSVMTQSMAVRRLTPTECERLQGFPDNYTNIPWRKKEEAPDGPRYKALGNSMAVPCMQWIGDGISHVTERI